MQTSGGTAVGFRLDELQVVGAPLVPAALRRMCTAMAKQKNRPTARSMPEWCSDFKKSDGQHPEKKKKQSGGATLKVEKSRVVRATNKGVIRLQVFVRFSTMRRYCLIIDYRSRPFD